jgi:cytochrome c oxidase subunit I+III
MIFLMAIFSYLYLWGIHPGFWRSPPDPWWLVPIVGCYGAAGAVAIFGRWMLARKETELWTPGVLIVVAAGALLVGVILDFRSWGASGLAPDASGQGATVYALLSLQAMLIGVAALMAAYLSARNSRGLIVRPRNNSYDLVVIFIAYTAAQGVIGALLTRLFPGTI